MEGKNPRSSTAASQLGGNKTALSSETEERLVKYVNIMNAWGFGLTKVEVLDVIKNFVTARGIQTPFKHNRPGNNWWYGFKKRHKLYLKKTERLEGSRARQAGDPFIINNFYDKVEEVIREKKMHDKPQCIWNADETSFNSDPGSTRVVCSVGTPAKDKQVEVEGTLQQERMVTEIAFHEWFKNVFLNKVTELPALLIYDGHLSHISIELVELAIQHDVTLFKLPPHTSHILQPLDVCVFWGVKSKWDQYLADWARHHIGQRLSKKSFADILGKTWKSMDPSRSSEQNVDKTASIDHPLLSEESMPSTSREPNNISLNDNNSEMESSPGTCFQNLLLQKVTQTAVIKSVKRRIDVAEIITKESYLATLKKKEEEKLAKS
ncbi:hypothetical protein NQ314_019682 [Rhamnusium bicolor]|uniref:HTH CENPB-type domain-containing protein n=1 Tax=Rhamnusium bicolor TaxID=1586634 RepID=A0AAV8WNN7_9CUCU|nr:hypothetical protein NQ314_019682 [Rhamnusium bicolor]